MRHINFEEWNLELAKILRAVQKRVPMVEVSMSEKTYEIHIETDCCTGTCSLRIVSGGEYMESNVLVASGRALTGSMSEVECGLVEYRAVVDAMHFCKSKTANLKIYVEGSVPCDRCSGRGKTNGGKCKHCKEGLR